MKAEDEHRRSGDDKSGSGEIDATTKDIFTEDALDPIYQHKARVLNDAIQEIGMGRYQWALFVVTGFGWLVDNLWPLVFQPALMWSKQRSLWGFFTDLPGSPVIPNIVIIDGLDECSDEDTQLRILSIIQSAYQQAPHFPLRLLICSRPESWIQEAFADDPLLRLSKRIILDDSLAAREDTRKYYLHHFQEIVTCRKYRHIQFPSPWPSKRDLEILVEWACSQFIFAVTVIKFIKDASRHPIEQLRIILGKITPHPSRMSPYQQLDTLYEVILSANPDQEEVLDILAALLVLPGHLETSSANIELVLGLSTGQLPLTLRAMHSVLDIPDKSENKIHVYHTSFTDYLCDQTRSRQFHVDIDSQKRAIARRWLQNLTTSRVQTYTSHQLYGTKAKDFFAKWIDFCESIPEPTRDLLEHLWNVDLASMYMVSCLRKVQGWNDTFKELVLWVQKYVSLVPRCTCTCAYASRMFPGLVKTWTRRKLETAPRMLKPMANASSRVSAARWMKKEMDSISLRALYSNSRPGPGVSTLNALLVCLDETI
ncbi:hypothetical protein PQX77_017416 [Marasmius sp. AFHP31]|nr:hypothetical protein PQX77_017416 [Marasmius sp. AFHP31]